MFIPALYNAFPAAFLLPPLRPKRPISRRIIFAMPVMFFANPLKVFTICADKVCYKLANMRYKLANTCYKVCNKRYKVCNKNFLI